MENKDLTKDYLDKVLDSAIYFKKGNFPDMPLYNKKSIIDAFEAGRKSVIDSIPDLEWERYFGGYLGETPIFNYYIEIEETAKEKYTLIAPEIDPMSFSRLCKAKQAANEHFKQTLKQALKI